MVAFCFRSELIAKPAVAPVRRFLRHAGALMLAALVALPGTADAARVGDAVVIGRGVNPEIAVNEDGAAVAVWERRIRSSGELAAAVRSASGRWSASRTIGITGSSLPGKRRQTSIDVAIDPQGNIVVVWTRTRSAATPTADVMTVRRSSGGRWSDPLVLASVVSPHEDVNVGPHYGIRPRVMLDANGEAVAAWARVLPAGRDRFQEANARYVVEAATMTADGFWSRPQSLGETRGNPALDVAPTGESAVVWTTGTIDSTRGIFTSGAVIAATRPAGGVWSQPELVVGDQGRQVDGIVYSAASFVSPQVAVERDGRMTALWQSTALASGRVRTRLQVATRTGTRQWSAPETLDRLLSGGARTHFGADSRGEIHAVWLTRAVGGSNDVALHAATRDVNGRWSAPTAAFGRSAQTRLTDAAMSADGWVIALVARDVKRIARPVFWQSQVAAYVRTPDRVWLPRQVVGRPRTRVGHSCNAGKAALADDGRGVAVWICRTGAARAPVVQSATIAPG